MRHLDGRLLRVLLPQRAVIQPGTFKMVPNAGMPIPGTGGMRFGDLYIKFNVVLPPAAALTQATFGILRAALPRTMDRAHLAAAKNKEERSSGNVDMSDGSAYAHVDSDGSVGSADAEEVTVEDVSVEVRRARVQAQNEAARHGSSGEAYESDDEEGGGRGGQRVQCAQQ